jgi:hypothetical protein
MSSPGSPMRIAAAHQASLMLRAPWQWRRNDGSLWARRLYEAITVLAFGGPALAVLIWTPARLAWPVLSLLGLCAAVGLFVHQFAALLRLDHPHAAHAVPGHRNAVRLAALVAWLAGVGLCAAATALMATLVLQIPARAGLAAALAAGTVMLLVAAAYRWWGLWVVWCIVPTSMAIPGWSGIVVKAFSWAHGIWLAQPLTVTATVLVAQALALVGLFGHGDAAHARDYAMRERWRVNATAGLVGKATPLAALGRWGEWLGRPLQRLSDAWLARVCVGARSTPASVMARAEVVLYANQHWVRHLAMAGFVQAVLVICMALVTAWVGVTPATMLEHGQMGISIGLASMCLSPLLGVLGALWHSRREQALLMLLPGMPQGPALNRVLATRQAFHGLLIWSATLPGFALAAWFGATPEMLAFPLVVLPLLAWSWRDASRLQQPRPALAAWPHALCLLAGALSLGLLRWQPAAWGPWLAAVLGLTAVLLCWRWQRLASLPQALPAGRLG